MLSRLQSGAIWAGKYVAFPALIYFAIFAILTFSSLEQFSTHFLTGPGDGMQNVWNLWWVNHALTELHQSPWRSPYLHSPAGVSLVAHTLNSFNGFLGTALLTVLTLVQTFNTIVVFTFVAAGVTAFHLCRSLTRSWVPSLIGGFVFTFSSFHFAHAQEHMQLTSLEWIPLFALSWLWLNQRPSMLRGVAAAGALVAVFLCDYYYFFYCVLFGAFFVCWQLWRARSIAYVLERERLRAWAAFTVVVLVATLPFIVSLISLNANDPLYGAHDPRTYSLDLLAPLIPGGHWRFNGLTHSYWSRLPGNIDESSVHLGFAVCGLITYVAIARKRVILPLRGFWFATLAIFAILALGPRLHVWGFEIPHLPLPYVLMEIFLPPLRLAGCPVRMMVMVTLVAAVLTAVAIHALWADGKRQRIFAALALIVMVFEFLPTPLPTTQLPVPRYIRFLSRLPSDGAVADSVSRGTQALFFQTIHQQPLATGYVSRLPTSLHKRKMEILWALKNRSLRKLRNLGVRYAVFRRGGRAEIIDLESREVIFPLGRR
jgi:hypothetical protein